MKIKGVFATVTDKLGSESWYHAYTLANLAAGGASILIPLYVLHLGGGVSDIGLLTAVGNLVGIPASLTWGALSDRWNRRKYFVVIGLMGVGISFLLMGLVRSYSLLILLNSVYILFWMAAACMVTILITDKEKQSFWDDKIGSFNFNAGLGWSIGLAVGFAWSGLGGVFFAEQVTARYVVIFVLLGFSALVGGWLAFNHIPGEPKMKSLKFKGNLTEASNMVTERFRYLPAHLYYFLKPSRLLSVTDKLGGELTRFLLSAALIFIGFSIFSVPLPAYFRTVVGLDEGVIYLLFIANALSSTLLYRPAARFTRKQGPLKILPASLASRIILFPLIVAPFGLMQNSSSQLLAVAIIFVAVGSTWAFINVSNLVIVSRLSEGRFKGQAFGLYNAIIGASFVFGSLVGGYFAEYSSYLATFLLASLFMAVGLTIIRKIPFGKVSPKEEA